MKKKYAALIFAVVLAVTSVSGCSGDTEDADAGALSGSDYAGSTVYGEVTDITDSVITVSVMEMNETAVDGTGGDADSTDGAGSTDDADSTADTDDAADTRAEGTDADDTAGDTTDDDAGDSVDDAAAGETTDDTAGDAGDVTGDGTGDAIPDGEDGGFSMFTGTGETLKITVTDDTTIYSMSMGPGGDMEMPGGDMGDGEAPEMPDGEVPETPADSVSDSDSNTDVISDFSGSSDGSDDEVPEKPEGESDPSETPADSVSDSDPDTNVIMNLSGSSEDSDSEAPEIPEGDSNDTGDEVPEKPEGDGSGTGDEAPEIPEGESGDMGEAPDGSNTGDEVPEMPDGDGSTGDDEAPEMPDGEGGDMSVPAETEEIELSDISVGDVISVTFDDDGNATEITVISAGGTGDGNDTSNINVFGSTASGVDSYTAVAEYTSDTEIDEETYSSTGTDENAIHVYEGATVSLDNITVTRDSAGSTGGDNSSFYGVGAAILTTDGTTYISNADISTDAAGGAGVFAYGGAIVYVSDSTITTQQDTSGGIHAAGGGTLYAWDLTVETNGESSAAIRSDRGGGTMVVDGGSYTSNGTGSPAVYSTADITINDATLTATSSEAVCIEGLNSLRLYDCDLTGSMSDNSQNDCTWNVILYQSMSGDSEVGNSTFEMQGGSLTAENGGMFYTTNTESTFTLCDVDITYASDSEFFLKCTGNSNERGWGTSGSNGADCLFTAISQEMEGTVIWDSISQLDFYMTDGSTLTGSVEDDETNAGDGGDGYCNVYIDESSTWIVTGDSVLTALYCEGTIVDEDGNTVTIQGTDGTVYLSGTSSCTITVTTYEDTADTSGASTLSSWSDYEVEEP